MAVKKYTDIRKLNRKKNIEDRIKNKLREAKRKYKAYTVSGLLIDEFKVKVKDIDNKNFSKWKKGVPALYTKTRTVLERLVRQNLVVKTKDGKAYVYYLK